MRKLILTPLAVAALTLAPAAVASADEACGTSPVTTTYHEVHEIPEPVVAAAGLEPEYEKYAHKQVECGEGPLPGVGIGPIFG